MNQPLRRFALALTVLALVSCATASKPDVQSQSDPGTNLAAWRSFAIKSDAGGRVGDEPMRMLDVSIQNALRDEFTRRGYELVTENPQFLVTYDIAAEDKVKSNPVRVGIGIGSWGGSGGGSVNVGSSGVSSYREGRLVVHVLDAAANREVWVGSIIGKVNKNGIDADAVAQVVATTLKDYPPRAP
jgi:hypothetical protein